MSEIKLLPCPFCGREAIIYETEQEGIYMIGCKKGCSVSLMTERCEGEKRAIKQWNTRKPVKAVLERLEKELKLADKEKERCTAENALQFDTAKGYATGIYNAIEIIKEVLMLDVKE